MKKMSQIEREIAVHRSHCFNDIMDEAYGCKYGPDNECPSNRNLDELITGLSLFEKQVLRDLTEIGYDWFAGYAMIDFRGHEKKEVKKVIDKLKRMGLIEFSSGLMYEDEYRTAGSGWRVVRKHEVIEHFENTESFDEAMNRFGRSLTPDEFVKIKDAHERELTNRFR